MDIVGIRLSDADRNRLDELAAALGVSRAGVVRLMLQRAEVVTIQQMDFKPVDPPPGIASYSLSLSISQQK